MFKIEKSGVAATTENSLSFSELVNIVKKLPRSKKIKLSQEIEKETLDSTLTTLLSSFKTKRLSQREIDLEVEIVRSQLYAKKK